MGEYRNDAAIPPPPSLEEEKREPNEKSTYRSILLLVLGRETFPRQLSLLADGDECDLEP